MNGQPGDPLQVVVSRLSRYADPLPENYRDTADERLCSEIAHSFAAHMTELVRECERQHKVDVDEADPTKVEITDSDGSSVEVTVFGDQAFDLDYSPKGGLEDEHGHWAAWETFTELDRSGLVFLSHMFVTDGKIKVAVAE